jgi:hypothetical protein
VIDEGLNQHWQNLCQAVATEQNPKKLMALVAELVKALDERDGKGQSNPENKSDRGRSSVSTRSEVGDQTCESDLFL